MFVLLLKQQTMRPLTLTLLLAATTLGAQTQSVDWPVYGGSPEHTHYSTINQITRENVNRLRVAWTYETHEEFPGSEMQANPIVVDGVLYATTPRLRVFALDAATGKRDLELRSERGCAGPALSAPRRRRHRRPRALHVSNQLWALDKKTGQPVKTFGVDGAVDLREDSIGRQTACRSARARRASCSRIC